ncbi:MarR family winged helix-turn-helix transcriptional regulator [Nocardioides sp. SYSU DS0651]|uniref:MarR family winged helix-turn-helix transcriptional regulator n=1 Tax=Nocardioides sp. SYSU DS0651 TaxID=3415955 RepID=UPI003F4B3260
MDAATEYRLLIADVYELAAASRRSGEEIARRTGQTAARWHVLSVLSTQPLTVSAAARRLGLARQSVHRVVQELLAEGLLAAEPNPDHKGAPLISTTSTGDEVLAELVRLGDLDRSERLRRVDLSADELARARRALRSILRALAEPPGDQS